TSGVRLRLATDSPRVRILTDRADTADEPRVFDLTHDSHLLASVTVEPGSSVTEFDLTASDQSDSHENLPVYELWLHQFHPTRVSGLQIDDGLALPSPRTIVRAGSRTGAR
ncbi:MAG: hypothetical protein ACOC2N_06930, partial [Spirochaetota bacterium]